MASNSWIRLTTGPYYVYPKPVGRLPFEVSNLQPITVLQSTEPNLNGTWAEKAISEFVAKDDVFNYDFLQVVVVTHADSASTKVNLEPSAIDVLKKYGMQRWEYAGPQPWKAGPYFAEGENLYQAWKMYADTSEAFYLPTINNPEDASSYLPFDISVFPPMNTAAVPSRLYFSADKDKPLHGARISVKDIYNLKGVRPLAPAEATGSYNHPAPRKTKTTTFADREIPTGDWIDTHAPFNPRGDGYLVPGGSSAGSGSAIASYNWLDYAIGTDTSGSSRWPAAHSGLCGFKPTYNVMPMDGIIPSSRQFDVPAYLTRDVKSANAFARLWFGAHRYPKPSGKTPTKLLYPLDYADPSRERTMSTNKQVLDVFEEFVQKLEVYLGVKRTPIDFSALWLDKSPHKSSETLDEYFLKFVFDYNKKFGRDPYLPPSIANRCITDAERAAAVKQVEVYKAWFESNFLGPNSGSLLDAVLVLPWTAGFANYRDTTKPIPNESFGHGFWSSYITSFTTGPELVFPIGTWTYDSKVTHRKERLPVAAGIVGASGSDFGVLQFVEDFLAGSGMQDHVVTGSEVFETLTKVHISDEGRLQQHL